MTRHALFGASAVLLAAALLSCAPTTPSTPMPTPEPSMAPTEAPAATTTPSNPISAEPTATPSAVASPAASASPASSPTPTASPSTSAIVSATTVSFKDDVVPVLKAHCADCHSAGGAGSLSVLMFGDNDAPRFEVIRSQVGEMIRQVTLGRMPRGRPGTVPDADLQVLKDWQDAGRPNN